MAEDVNVNISATDELSGPARTAIKSLDKLGDKAQSAAAKTEILDSSMEGAGDEARDLAIRVAYLERKLKTMGNEALKSAAKIQALDAKLSRVSRGGGIFGRMFGGGRGGAGGGIAVGLKLGRMFRLFLIPAILDAVGAVATLGSALGALGAAAIGGLGPLTGLLAAYPGYLAAIAQGFGVVKLSMDRITNEAAILKQPFTELKGAVSDALIPGFIKLFAVVNTYMPLMRRQLSNTAKVMSGTVTKLSDFLGQAGTKSAVSRVMQTNTAIIRELGKAAVPVLRMMLNILVAAGPMLTRFASNFAQFVQRLSKSSNNQRGLTYFFDKTYKITKGLLEVVSDLGVAFYNIFKVGAKWGGDMGRSLLDMTKRFREWTGSAEGQNKIALWFEKMRPIVEEVGGLLIDLGKGLASLSMDDSVLQTFQTLRSTALPAIIKILQSASGKFLPTIAKILDSIANIVTNTDILPNVLGAMSKVLEIISKLPKPLAVILGYILTIKSVLKFTPFLGFFSLFGSGATKAAGSVGLLTKALNLLKTGAGNVAYVLGGIFSGAGTWQQGLGLLGQSAKDTGNKMASAFAASKAGPLILAAIGLAALNSAEQLRSLHEEVKSLNAELAKTGSPEAFAANKQKQNDILGQSGFSYVDDAFGDAFRVFGWLGKGLVTGDPGSDFLDNFAVWRQKKEADALRQQAEQTRLLQRQVAGEIFAPDTQQGMYGNPVNIPKEFMVSDEQVALVQKIATEIGVDWTQGFDKAYEAINRFKVINYDSAPAIRDLANSLTTLKDSASDTGARIDAFNAALQSLNIIATHGGKRDALVDAARGADTLTQSLQGANVELTKGGLKFKAWASNNRALHDALTQQAANIANVASATYESTDSTKQATKAYKNQYDILVNQLSKGLDITQKQARNLANQYMATPKMMARAFKDSRFLDWLGESQRTYAEVRRWINTHPIKPRVEPTNITNDKKWVRRRQKRSMNAWADRYARVPKTSSSTTQVTAFETPGLSDAVSGMSKVKDLTKWIDNHPAQAQVESTGIDMALTVAQSLRDVLMEIGDIRINVGSGTGTGGSGKKKKKDKKNRMFGGPVTAGEQYIVGEAGPEAFLGSNGMFQMIGVHGQEHRTFPQDGIVIPNQAVTAARDALTYTPVQASVHIGTINAASDIDVVQAVRKGIRDAERNARERR